MKSAHSYRERDYTFGQMMLTLRTSIGLTQAGLGERLRVSRRAVVEWEGGLSYPKVDSLKRFIALCVQHQAFTMGREEEEIQALWKAARQRVLLDELWLHKLLSSAHPEAIVPANGATDDSSSDSLHRIGPIVSAPTMSFPRIDWTGALDVSSFRGREVELAVLSRWLLQERSRQEGALMATLATVIAGVQRGDNLIPTLQRLGQRHKGYGVKAEHYPILRIVLLETFHHYLGPRFTPQMQEAWEEAFEMISAEMLKGADMLPPQEEGDFR